MKLLSIVAGFALAQSACAALCEQGRYYCGREFKKFSNADKSELSDDHLYVCASYKASLPNTFGKLVEYKHEPVLLQPCEQGCVDGGQKNNDYCGGETLLWRDDRLAPCAHACYSRAANRVRNADTLLEELSIPRDLYTELFICLNFYTFKYRRTSSAERNKEVDDLNGVLLQERAKAQKIYFAELKRFCNGGELLDGKNRCHVD